MISSINLNYLQLKFNAYAIKKILTGWKKKEKLIKKHYFRKYQVKVWLHKGRYLLMRSYLINSNLWYTGKKGILLRFSIYKISINTAVVNSAKIKINSIVNDYNKKV